MTDTGIATAGTIVARKLAQEEVDHDDHQQDRLEDRLRVTSATERSMNVDWS